MHVLGSFLQLDFQFTHGGFQFEAELALQASGRFFHVGDVAIQLVHHEMRYR